MHLHKANNEGSLSYERDTLLDYKSYIGNEIYKLELDLNKLDRLLEFVDEQYQNDKYSTFINDSVKENEKLLPERMVFTQSILWGEKGIIRKTGISRLNKKQRTKESYKQ